ncbi:MAG: GNAT family N-acetyltransferase [Cytophagales bacterium]|nr:GNAT family N-acetyltransferase [Bernardetiaceae bacterium]MDW8204462.1 GNAT family N-acetyltransferase [Cytophagales bacterium]
MQTTFPVHIRLATREDAALLANVGRTSFYHAFADTSDASDMAEYLAQAFSEEQIASELSNSNNYFFIMETQQSKIAGYAKLIANQQHNSLPENSNWWKLHRFYLMPEFIGTGVANLLMNQLKNFVLEKNGKGMWLATWVENGRAIRFYEKCGFTICGSDRFIMGKSITCDYVMKWEAQ